MPRLAIPRMDGLTTAGESERGAVAPVAGARTLLSRLQYPILAVLLVAFLILGWRGRGLIAIAGGDELIYLSLSQSLEEGAYREIFRPQAPLHVQYPPGYPAWLTVMRTLTGGNLEVIRAANLVLVALVIVLLFRVTRRLAGPGLALVLVLLLVLNQAMLTVGGSLMSEPLFMLLATVTLVKAYPSTAAGPRSYLGLIALALLAFLTRAVGLALVLALGFWFWSERRWKALTAWVVASGLVIGGWSAYTMLARADESVRSYAGDFTGREPASFGLLADLAKRVWHNGYQYVTADLPDLMRLPSIPGTLLDNVAWLGVNVLLLTAGLLVLWKAWKPAAVYLVLSVGILLLWVWQDGRLLAPILPLVLLAFLLGAKALVDRLPARARNVALAALLALPIFGAVRGARNHLAQYRECDRANVYVSPGCYTPATRAFAAAAEHLRTHSAPDAVVLTLKPSSMHFLSGRRSEYATLVRGMPPGEIPDTLRGRNIQFVLVRRGVPPVLWAVLPTCRQFRVEASFPPEALLLSLAAPEEAGPDACSALAELDRQVDPALLPHKW